MKGERSGMGMYTFKESGIIYKGGWQGDKYHGEGLFFYPGGEKVKVRHENGKTVLGTYSLIE